MFFSVTRAQVFALALMSGLLFGSAARADRVNETAKLDLGRFLGTWYELARYDHYFERGCVGVTATYSRRAGSDTVKVLNRCVKDRLDGEVKTVEGKLWQPDATQPGKLEVQFFWPFTADFWVLDVAPDYSWALVGEPKQKSCWIFSRTPTLPDDVYESLLRKLEARGYSREKLLRVQQAP